MSKQPRKLWFGDWQRDEEPVPATREPDTVLISPVDDAEDDPAQGADDRPTLQRRVALITGLALIAVLAFALAAGGRNNQTASPPPPQAAQVAPPAQVPQGPPLPGFSGYEVTGREAAKAAAAALAQFPGSIERVTRDSSGAGYIVHVIQAEGGEVHVLVDGEFHVKGSDAGAPPNTYAPGSSQ